MAFKHAIWQTAAIWCANISITDDHTLKALLQSSQDRLLMPEIYPIILSHQVEEVNQELYLQVIYELASKNTENVDVAAGATFHSSSEAISSKLTLLIACNSDTPELVRHISEKPSFDLNEVVVEDSQATMLHYSAGRLAWRVVKFLLGLGSDPNAKDTRGRTPLHYVLDNDMSDSTNAAMIIDSLIEHGAKLIPDTDNHVSCLHLWASHESAASLLEQLVYHGAMVNERTGQGRNVLHILASTDRIDDIACLRTLSSTAQFAELARTTDNEGCLPVHLAARCGSSKAFETLRILEHESSLWSMKLYDGRSMLNVAAYGFVTSLHPFTCALENVSRDWTRLEFIPSPVHDCVSAISLLEAKSREKESKYQGVGSVASDELIYKKEFSTASVDAGTILKNFCAAIQMLVDCSFDITSPKANGNTPLHSICHIIAEHSCIASAELCAVCHLYIGCLDALQHHFVDISKVNNRGLSVFEVLLDRISLNNAEPRC